MARGDEQLPAVLVVDDEPQKFEELLRFVRGHEDGRLVREFAFEYVSCFPELNAWYRRNRGRFVSLLVLDDDFGTLGDEAKLLDFPAAGLKPAAGSFDRRALQGFVIYHRLRQANVDRVAPVLFTSSQAALRHGQEFADFIIYQGYGSCSFVPEPAAGRDRTAELVLSIDGQALRPLSDERRRHWREHHRMVVGRSRLMAHLVHEIERVGPSEGPVLLLGSPGVGKELAANALHRCSARYSEGDPRREYPLTVNMVALERNLVLDELFGHERGAFTGATAERAGIFESGEGTTVFLDEIGDIDAELQQKLLRVIEYHRVRRLGSSTETSVDIRILAATNRPLPTLQTQFRWDFYTRIVQQTVVVPSLRDRWRNETRAVLEADIAELFEFTVDEANRNPRHRRKLNPDRTAVRLLTQLAEQHLDGTGGMFAGEMRSLRSVIERSYERAQYDGAPIVGMSQVASTVTRYQALGCRARSPTPAASVEGLFGSLKLPVIEKAAIAEALAKSNGNRSRAAEMLGLHRNTLRDRMKEHGLSW